MSWGECPNCKKEIFERKFFKKIGIKITEICPNCGIHIIRNKTNQIVGYGKKITTIQYVIVLALFLILTAYFVAMI